MRNWLIPGGLGFLLLGLSIGLLSLFGRPRLALWGRRWLITLVVGYWWCSLPIGADVLTAVVAGGARPLMSVEDARGASVVVVLDAATARFRAMGLAIDTPNAAAAYRALEAIRVYRLLGDPVVVVTAGGDARATQASPEGAALRDAIVRSGVPAPRVWLDSSSPNTRAHANSMVTMLESQGVTRIVLVTSSTHIRRATSTFQAAGFDVIPSPAQEHSDIPGDWRWTRLTPSLPALAISEAAIRDTAALLSQQFLGVFGRRQ